MKEILLLAFYQESDWNKLFLADEQSEQKPWRPERPRRSGGTLYKGIAGRRWGDEVARQIEVGLGSAACATQWALDSRLEILGSRKYSEQQRAQVGDPNGRVEG